MTSSLIWLHDQALRNNHPVFSAAPDDSSAIFIWDEDYFKSMGYSLKRLVFIYESLCELPIDIIHGDTHETLRNLNPKNLFVPHSIDPFVTKIISELSQNRPVHVIRDEPFVRLPDDFTFKRFFNYWNKAEKRALMPNGDRRA